MNILNFNFQSFGNMLKSLWNGLCNVLAPVFEGVFQHISDIFTFVTDSILSVLDVFIGLFSGNWEQCWDGSKGIFTAIWDFVVNQFSNILNVLRDVADVFLGWFGTSWNEVWMSIWNNVKSSISSVISGIYNTIKGGFDNAVNYVKGLASDAWNWGRDIVSNIIDGLRSMIGSLADSVSGIADTIHSYLHFSVPDVGPLTDFESWMPDFMKGLADGINKSKKVVAKAVLGVADTMKLSLNSEQSYNFDGMMGAMMNGTPENSVVNNYCQNDNSRTVNQTNNSPKSLSRLEIYRQTKNAVDM